MIILGVQLASIFQFVLVALSFSLICALFYSTYMHKNEVKLYSLLLRDNKRISKVAVAFVFLLIMIVYQTLVIGEISRELVELLAITLGAEVGTSFVNNKYATPTKPKRGIGGE